MNESLESIITALSVTIVCEHHDKRTICGHYDRISLAIKNSGFSDDVAHHWAVFALNRVYGSIRVAKAISA